MSSRPRCCSAFPALTSRRRTLTTRPDANRSSTGARAPRLRRGLVVVETALALVLLAGAGALLTPFLALRATHPGFDASHALKLDLRLPQPRFAELDARAHFYEAALTRLRGLPGVQSAAFVSDLPLNGSSDSLGFHIPGRPASAAAASFTAGFNIATDGYFTTMGIPLKAGREFSSDRANSMPVVIVNGRRRNGSGLATIHRTEIDLLARTRRLSR